MDQHDPADSRLVVYRCKAWLEDAHPDLYNKFYSDSECGTMMTLMHFFIRSLDSDLRLISFLASCA